MATTPTAERLRVNVYLGYGNTDIRDLLSFEEASTTTGFQKIISAKELATSVTDSSLDLSTIVDTATWICLRPRNGVGFHVQLSAGIAAGSRFQVSGSGVLLWKNANSTPPTLFFSNITGAADKEFVEIVVLGTSS